MAGRVKKPKSNTERTYFAGIRIAASTAENRLLVMTMGYSRMSERRLVRCSSARVWPELYEQGVSSVEIRDHTWLQLDLGEHITCVTNQILK